MHDTINLDNGYLIKIDHTKKAGLENENVKRLASSLNKELELRSYINQDVPRLLEKYIKKGERTQEPSDECKFCRLPRFHFITPNSRGNLTSTQFLGFKNIETPIKFYIHNLIRYSELKDVRELVKLFYENKILIDDPHNYIICECGAISIGYNTRKCTRCGKDGHEIKTCHLPLKVYDLLKMKGKILEAMVYHSLKDSGIFDDFNKNRIMPNVSVFGKKNEPPSEIDIFIHNKEPNIAILCSTSFESEKRRQFEVSKKAGCHVILVTTEKKDEILKSKDKRNIDDVVETVHTDKDFPNSLIDKVKQVINRIPSK